MSRKQDFLDEFTKEDFINVIGVRAAILKDDKILLVNERGEGYETPGGKLRPEETLKKGLTREIREETGYEVEISRPLLTNIRFDEIDGLQYKLIYIIFECKPIKKAQEPSEKDLKDVKWFSREEVKGLLEKEEYHGHDKELFSRFVKGNL